MDCLLYQSPTFYNIAFLFAGLSTFGTWVNFNWIAHYVECSNVSTTHLNLQKGISIWDVHQFIDHFVIPLDSCNKVIFIDLTVP